MENRPADEDSEDFRAAMADVRRRSASDRVTFVTPPPPPRPRSLEADERAVLEELRHAPLDFETMEAGDALAYRTEGLQDSAWRRLRRGGYRVGAELDLHGYNRAGAQAAVRSHHPRQGTAIAEHRPGHQEPARRLAAPAARCAGVLLGAAERRWNRGGLRFAPCRRPAQAFTVAALAAAQCRAAQGFGMEQAAGAEKEELRFAGGRDPERSLQVRALGLASRSEPELEHGAPPPVAAGAAGRPAGGTKSQQGGCKSGSSTAGATFQAGRPPAKHVQAYVCIAYFHRRWRRDGAAGGSRRKR
jgi:hypothetical protein